MDIDAAVTALRYVNVALGLAAFLWLLLKLNAHWRHYTGSFKAYSMALLFYAFSSTYSSGEALAQGLEPGLRPVFILVANASLLSALWVTRGRHTAGYAERD